MTDKTPPPKKTAKKAAKKTAGPKKAAKTAAVKKAPKKTIAKEPTKKSPSTSSTFKTIQKNFEDDAVKVEFTLEAGCKLHLTASMSQKIIEEAKTQALKDVSKSISLPGFRKGKVPKSLVEKNYAGNLQEQQTQILLQKGLDHALKLAELRPLNYRNIKPKVDTLSENEAIFSYTFEAYPEIPAIPLEKIQLEKVPLEEVTDQKVEEVIDVMRSYRAKWNEVEDRAVQIGDYVDVTVTNLENDTKLVDHKRVQVEKGKLSKWLIDLLVVLTNAEQKKANIQWDTELPTSDKKDFKATHCNVEVLGIFKGELPPVDDEFAKAMGTQSVADLRTQVLLRLNQNAKQAQENQQKILLDQALDKLVDFELPESLIKAEIETKTRLKQQESKKTLSEEETKEVEEDARTALKLFFILQKIANERNIIVTEQELRDMLSERIAQLNLPEQIASNTQYKNQLIQEMRMNCFIDLLTEKVKRHLLKEVAFA